MYTFLAKQKHPGCKKCETNRQSKQVASYVAIGVTKKLRQLEKLIKLSKYFIVYSK